MLADCITRFNQLYTNEEDCISLIHRLRWPSGFQCFRCQHKAAYVIRTRRLPLFECRNCGHQTSLTSGTVMHKSRTSLHKWLLTMYIVATCEESINATDLSTLLSVTYKTAWSMLKKIRQVISETDRKTLLSGIVEAKSEIYMKQFIPTDERLQQEKTAIVARTIPQAHTGHSSYFKIKLLDRDCEARENLTQHDIEQFALAHLSSDLTHLHVNKRFVTPYKSTSLLPKAAKKAFCWLNDTFHG